MTTLFEPENNPPDSSSKKSAGSLEDESLLSQFPAHVPDIAGAVIARFESDLQNPAPCQYDAEFISAYLDGVFNLDNPDSEFSDLRQKTFEKHLPSCPPCADQLGGLSDTIRAYHAFSFHLENRLETWSIASHVIDAYQKNRETLLDETILLPLAGCGVYTWTQLSAFLDAVLDSDELLAVEQHMASCTQCLHDLENLTDTQTAIATFYQTITLKHPVNAWSAIEPLVKPSAKILSFPGKRQWIPIGSVAGVAAAVMLIVFSGHFAPQLSAPSNLIAMQSQANINPNALEQAMSADAQDSVLQRQLHGSNVVQVTYQTPESYLFSQDSDILPQDMLKKGKTDAAAIALTDFSKQSH